MSARRGSAGTGLPHAVGTALLLRCINDRERMSEAGRCVYGKHVPWKQRALSPQADFPERCMNCETCADAGSVYLLPH